MDVRLRPLDELRRDLRVDQVVGQARGDRQDHQHAADQRHAVGRDAQHVLPRRQIAMDEALHDERVERRDRRRLDGVAKPPRSEPSTKTGSSSSHFASHSAASASPHAERRALARCDAVPSRTPSAASRPSISRPGSKPPMKRSSIEAFCDDDAVEDQRQRGREEQAERAGGGEQADREALAIAVLEQRRQQQAAEREDRDARSAGEQREERAQRRGGNRRAAGGPTEQRAEDAQQPLGRLPFREQKSGQREERNRGRSAGRVVSSS